MKNAISIRQHKQQVPCRYCTKRSATCHSNCGEYKNWKEKKGK